VSLTVEREAGEINFPPSERSRKTLRVLFSPLTPFRGERPGRAVRPKTRRDATPEVGPTY